MSPTPATDAVTRDLYRTATADGAGRAAVNLGGPGAWSRWRVTGVALTSTSAATPRFDLYRNSEQPGNLLATTPRGLRAVTIRGDAELVNGESLVAVWTGATPGALGTIVVTYEDRFR